MTKHFIAACLGLLMACGSSQPKTSTTTETGSGTETAACAATDCGAEPPISPSACPEGAAISTECHRSAAGACERKVLCDGKDANEIAPPAAAQP